MTNRQIVTAIERLVEHVPAMLKDVGLRRDTCILTTRIVSHVFAEFGVPVASLHCQVAITNAQYRRMLEADEEDQAEKWEANGAWAVMIGYGIDPGAERPGYDGHVIPVVKNRWAVDLTIAQASRPRKAIKLKPVYFEVPRAFVRGEQPMAFNTAEGATILYVPKRDERQFVHAPDWRMTRPGDDLVKAASAIARGERVAVAA